MANPIDTPDPDALDFDAAHARLVALRAHPTVQDAIAKLRAGGSFLKFLLALYDVPEVRDAIKTVGGGVDGVVGMVVTGALAPELGPLAALGGSGAVALLHIAEGALAHAEAKAAGTSPGSSS